MTRQDFINYGIDNHPLNKTAKCVGFEPYDRQELEADIRDEYNGKYDTDRILSFFEGVGTIYFHRTEKKSGDKLTVDIRWLAYIYYWDDIDSVVNRIGYIENCSGIIETLYLSETGKFYSNDHTLIAENEEDFFDYLTTVEYDYHPVISKQTYEMLRFFGWREDRRIDITKFNKEMLMRGIELTQKQLDFFKEYSNLTFSFDDFYSCWWFYSLEDVLQDNSSNLRTGYKETISYEGETVAYKVLVCGDSPDTMFPISIDAEGRLLRGPFPLGRNTLESINHLVSKVSPEAEWMHPSRSQKME